MAEVKIEPYDECLKDNEFTFIKKETFENEDTVSYIEIERNSGEYIRENIFEESKESLCIPFDINTENASFSEFNEVNYYS